MDTWISGFVHRETVADSALVESGSGADNSDGMNGPAAEKGASQVEILAALSCALDMVEGHRPGHAIRTCMIALKIAEELEVSAEMKLSLTHAALMKDTGCSSSSVRIHQLLGLDDHAVKAAIKYIDWSDPGKSMKFALNYADSKRGAGSFIHRLSRGFSWPRQVVQEIAAARRQKGSEFAELLGLGSQAAQAIRCLDEHYDGAGLPMGLKKREIPWLSRILAVAQAMDTFASSFGSSAAYRMLDERKGRWFDPEVHAAADRFAYDAQFWNDYGQAVRDGGSSVQLRPNDAPATEDQIDDICEAFAAITDAKSAWSSGHSTRVGQMAEGIARVLQLPIERVFFVRRAGLLHDIGKLGVASSILDKPGGLTEIESAEIRLREREVRTLLSRVEGFSEIAQVGFAHDSDGESRGVWRGLDDAQLNREMKIVAAADVFDALVSERPYKPALPVSEALDQMQDMDSVCLEAIREVLKGPFPRAA